MAEVPTLRRFYLRKRIGARLEGDLALAGVWQSKQEEQPGGIAVPDDFPSRERLVAAGYTAKEDFNGADENELWQSACLGPTEAHDVLAAAAAL
jgi:hypothetical protein